VIEQKDEPKVGQKTERGKKSAKTRMDKKERIISLARRLSGASDVNEAQAIGRQILCLFDKPASETYIVIVVGKKQQYAGPFRNRDAKEKLDYFVSLFKDKGATISTTPATEEARHFAAELMAASVVAKADKK